MLHAQSSLFVYLAAGLQEFMQNSTPAASSEVAELRVKKTHEKVNKEANKMWFFNKYRVRANMMDSVLNEFNHNPNMRSKIGA